MAGPEKLAVIVSSTSSRPNDVSMPISVAHDGFSHDTNKCYLSRDSNTGWADFKLASKVHVTKVSVAVRLGTFVESFLFNLVHSILLGEPYKTDCTTDCVFEFESFVNKILKLGQLLCQSFRRKLLLRNLTTRESHHVFAFDV